MELVNRPLSALAELVLDESQVVFHRLRGCPDATFCVRRLFEEFSDSWPAVGAAEEDAGLFALFVDLKKAFDSVPRAVI